MTLSRRELAEVAEELAAIFDPADAAEYRPRYNLAPTDRHYVLRAEGGRRWLERAQWGFAASVAGRPPLFNARAESAAWKDAFRAAYAGAGGRCVVPADGFYEWKSSGGERQPYWFQRRDGRLLLLAGLWDSGRFVVLTTEANALLGEIHDRMPAILEPHEAAAWLAGREANPATYNDNLLGEIPEAVGFARFARARLTTGAPQVLHPAPEDVLAARPVSSRVNSVRHDDPACLAEANAGPRQLTLV
jgi:putative SOS response-associated peptidase YedK